MLHGAGFGEEAGARNRAFFRVKWLQPAMKGTSGRGFPSSSANPDMRAVQGCPRDRALLANLLETFLVCHLWV